MADVVMIKLINGDTIVGEEVAVTEDEIILDHPLALQKRNMDSNDEGLLLNRYTYLTKDTSLSFKLKHVIIKTAVSGLMVQYYLLSNDMLYITDKNVESAIKDTIKMMEDFLNDMDHLDVDDDSIRDLALMEPISKLPS